MGCIVHILNNCIQNATNILPNDTDEVIVVKIYKHFYIYTVRVNNLKTFSNDIEIKYKTDVVTYIDKIFEFNASNEKSSTSVRAIKTIL